MRLALALLVLSTAAGAEPARVPALTPRIDRAQSHGPDCTCRALGRSFEVGETACIGTPEGRRVARCGMVLNNTSWTFTATPCPDS